jgi:predicted Zn-dependent peptidase
VNELRKVADERIPSDELEKARSFAKGRFVLQLESPQGLIMFGLRREVLESVTPDPEQILAELDKVTAEDVQRVARELIDGRGLNLAVIGPFDDPQRFEKLLA